MEDKILVLAEPGTIYTTQEILDRYGEKFIRAINGLHEDAKIIIVDKEEPNEKVKGNTINP